MGDFLLIQFLSLCIVMFVLVGIPMWRICMRAGFNPAWSLLVVIPYFGLLIVAARLGLSEWPKLRPERTPGI